MTQSDRAIVVAIFDNRQAVLNAIDALIKAGFHEEQLGFVARTHEEHLTRHQFNLRRDSSIITRGILGGVLGVADLLLVPFTGPADASNMLETALPLTEEAMDRLPHPGASNAAEQSKQASENAAPGQNATAEEVDAGEERQERVAGGVTGGVIGGALGAAAALLIPGVGPFVAGGIIAGVLGGGAIGAVAGTFLNTFRQMGVPEEHARYYENEVKTGRIIVTVKDTTKPREASEILLQHGASEVQTHV